MSMCKSIVSLVETDEHRWMGSDLIYRCDLFIVLI